MDDRKPSLLARLLGAGAGRRVDGAPVPRHPEERDPRFNTPLMDSLSTLAGVRPLSIRPSNREVWGEYVFDGKGRPRVALADSVRARGGGREPMDPEDSRHVLTHEMGHAFHVPSEAEAEEFRTSAALREPWSRIPHRDGEAPVDDSAPAGWEVKEKFDPFYRWFPQEAFAGAFTGAYEGLQDVQQTANKGSNWLARARQVMDHIEQEMPGSGYIARGLLRHPLMAEHVMARGGTGTPTAPVAADATATKAKPPRPGWRR